MHESKRSGVKSLTRAYGETILDKLPVFGKSGAFEYAVAAIAGIFKSG